MSGWDSKLPLLQTVAGHPRRILPTSLFFFGDYILSWESKDGSERKVWKGNMSSSQVRDLALADHWLRNLPRRAPSWPSPTSMSKVLRKLRGLSNKRQVMISMSTARDSTFQAAKMFQSSLLSVKIYLEMLTSWSIMQVLFKLSQSQSKTKNSQQRLWISMLSAISGSWENLYSQWCARIQDTLYQFLPLLV